MSPRSKHCYNRLTGTLTPLLGALQGYASRFLIVSKVRFLEEPELSDPGNCSFNLSLQEVHKSPLQLLSPVMATRNLYAGSASEPHTSQDTIVRLAIANLPYGNNITPIGGGIHGPSSQ